MSDFLDENLTDREVSCEIPKAEFQLMACNKWVRITADPLEFLIWQ